MILLDWIRRPTSTVADYETAYQSLRKHTQTVEADRHKGWSEWSRAMAVARRHQDAAAIAEARVCRLSDQILKMGGTPCE